MAVQYVRQYKVESHSREGTFYKVSVTDSGEWQCSCPAWIFKRKQCKHIQDAQEYERENGMDA